jgi:RNA polymerase sigma-70 factor (ECF subfamily)
MLVDGASGETPESAVLDQELWQAVRALPEQQRDAVLLVYGEDLKHAEAALIMGCSEKTVSWHLHEAKKRLRKTVQAVS